MTLKEKAADAAGAVAALKASQEKMATKLAALGVKADQIRSELPTLVDKTAQDALRQRRTGQRLKRKTADEKTEIEMQQMFRALVPLAAKDLAEIVVEAETLKGKIKTAKTRRRRSGRRRRREIVQYQYDNQNTGPITYVYFAPSGERSAAGPGGRVEEGE